MNVVEQNVYGQIVVIVIQTAAAVLVPMLVAIAALGLKKLGLDISAKQEARLTYVAHEAVKKVEEVAAARFKAGGPKMSPEEKFVGAVDAVMDQLPKVSLEKAELKVTTALPDLGLGASSVPLTAPALPVPVGNAPGAPAQ